MFEEKLIEQIMKAWETDQSLPHRDRKKREAPDPKDIARLIETAFTASIKKEEERSVLFSLVLFPQDKKETEYRESGVRQDIFEFNDPLIFNAESLTKIASSMDPKQSALLISPPGNNQSNYMIWGIAYFGSGFRRFQEIPAAIIEFVTFRPDLFTVTSVSPGSLLISRGGSQIGRLVFGEFYPAIPTPFTFNAMGKYVMAAIKDNDGFDESDTFYWQIYRDALDYLLFSAADRGHGGTIIILPQHKVDTYRKGFHPRYQAKGSTRIEKLILRSLTKQVPEFMMATNREISERLNFLAQLSCVDGALIISTSLELIAFGATLTAPPWQGKVVVGPDGFGGGGEPFDLRKYGTRHNSAVSFIGKYEDCLGFVISQDGPIRGFAKKDNSTVYCWPDCTCSMFVDR